MRRRRARRTDFGRHWIAKGQPFSRGGARTWHARAPPCPHPRQTWWGLKLPCAEPRCAWGAPYALYMIPPLRTEPNFAKYREIHSAADFVIVEQAEFKRSEWSGPGGYPHWYEWEQTLGPTPPAFQALTSFAPEVDRMIAKFGR